VLSTDSFDTVDSDQYQSSTACLSSSVDEKQGIRVVVPRAAGFAIVPVAEETRSPTAVAKATKRTSTNATRTGLEQLSMLRFSDSISTEAVGISALL